MLIALRVQNIALLESAAPVFEGGLQVITGETGAGKSLLVDALQLVLGVRADPALLRTGAQKGQVEANFALADAPAALPWLQENGFYDPDNELPPDEVVLARELLQSGRSVCRVNGTLVSAPALRALAQLLVDLHGQHEHQSLFQENRHIGILDSYLAGRLEAPLADYRAAYAEWRALKKKIAEGIGTPAERLRRTDMLQFQIEELKTANLKKGEAAELEARLQVLRHAETIREALFLAYGGLYEGSERRPSAYAHAAEAVRALEGIAAFAPEYAQLSESAKEVYYALEDLGLTLRDAKNQVDADPQELEACETRAHQIAVITRKYGGDEASALAFLEKAEYDLEDLQEAEEAAKRWSQEEAALCAGLLKKAEALTGIRRQGGRELAAAILTELAELGFTGARFDIAVTSPEAPEKRAAALTESGVDSVAFTMSANAGEDLKPLAKVASGGEVARIMLALQTVLVGRADSRSPFEFAPNGVSDDAHHNGHLFDAADIENGPQKAIGSGHCPSGPPTLIFDEIDSGISGRMAHIVALKMAKLSRTRQVFCVTHLTQMAAMADTHWLVQKHTQEGRTATTVTALDEAGRVQQLAAMASGASPGQTALAHAKELLESARKEKER